MVNNFCFWLPFVSVVFLVAVNGTFISVDLGGEFVKVAGPKGQAIDILLNEQSNRKSPLYVGFRKGERFFGDDAKNLAARFPDLMIAAVSKYVGTLANDTAWLDSTIRLGFGFVAEVFTDDNSGLVSFRLLDKEKNNEIVSYSPEELLGMFFTYVKGFSEKELEGPVRDAVLAVPASLPPRRRQALIDAAALAGIRVVALMNSNTAAALTLGLQNRGFDKPTNVVVFDMGSTHTEASLFTFLPPVVPSGGKRSSIADALGSITTRAVASDMSLGGRSFDRCLAKLIEDEYVAKSGRAAEAADDLRVLNGETVAKRRATISLMRAANKAKEVLSANQDHPVAVENIAPDRDFHTRITRSAFERECGHLFARAVGLVDQLFGRGHGLSLEGDVHRFELIGGATRIPKLVELLKSRIGRNVDRTLNSDEAAAVGAGYFGAALIGHFRLKGFGLHEQLPDNYSFALSPQHQLAEAASAQRLLFAAFNTSIPSRKIISLPNRSADFSIDLFRNALHDSTTTITGVKSALETVRSSVAKPLSDASPSSDGSSDGPLKYVTKISVRLAESGLVFIEDASIHVEYYVNVTRSVAAPKEGDSSMEEQILADTGKSKRRKVEDEPATSAEASDDGAISDELPIGESSVKDAESGSPDENAAAPSPDSKKQQKSAKKMVKKIVRELRQRTFPLLLSTTFTAPTTMTKSQASVSRERLRVLNAIDDARHEISTAKNDLEAYLIWARSEGVKQFAAKEMVAQQLLDKAKDIDAWLEDHHSDTATREDYLEKLAAIKGLMKRLLKQTASSPSEAQQQEEDEPATSPPGDEAAARPSATEDDELKTQGEDVPSEETSSQDPDAAEDVPSTNTDEGENDREAHGEEL